MTLFKHQTKNTIIEISPTYNNNDNVADQNVSHPDSSFSILSETSANIDSQTPTDHIIKNLACKNFVFASSPKPDALDC